MLVLRCCTTGNQCHDGLMLSNLEYGKFMVMTRSCVTFVRYNNICMLFIIGLDIYIAPHSKF